MLRRLLAVGACLAAAGCVGGPQTPAPTLSTPAAPAATPAAPAAPVKPVVGGALLGPVAQGVDAQDVDKAYAAQLAALDSGRRTPWKGQRGVFGYVEVGPEQSGLRGTCRDYTHVIYVGGLPRNGKGVACRDGAGWTASS